MIVISQQEELEHLNEASAEINRLELQLDVSNKKTVFHPLKGIWWQKNTENGLNNALILLKGKKKLMGNLKRTFIASLGIARESHSVVKYFSSLPRKSYSIW